MLHYTKTAGYAIHALSSLGRAYPAPRLVREVADETGLMKPYVAKVLNQLVHHGLIIGKRGYRGGVTLARSPEAISLLEVVRAVEGAANGRRCLFGLECCPAGGQCPAHEEWSRITKRIEAMLEATTLRDVLNSTVPPEGKPGVCGNTEAALLEGCSPCSAHSRQEAVLAG